MLKILLSETFQLLIVGQKPAALFEGLYIKHFIIGEFNVAFDDVILIRRWSLMQVLLCMSQLMTVGLYIASLNWENSTWLLMM